MTLDWLRRIPFLTQLKPKDLKEVYKISRIREFGPGENIIAKSESARNMFVVLSGRVKIFSRSRGKKRKTFAYLKPGDFFGEMALLEGKTRSASAEAVNYTRLLIISHADFKRLLISNPQLTFYLLQTVSERLRAANEEIEGLLFRNILGRVAKKFHELSRRGGQYRGGILLKDHYTQQELADMVGTTREPLTRAISTLRRAGFLALHQDRYYLPSPEKLSALCLVEP